MKLRLHRMGTEGKVAFANMTLICCALLVILLSIYNQSEAWLAAGGIAQFAIAILGFPVGWISQLGAVMDGPDLFLLAIFLPLNAYVWGYTVAAVLRSIKRLHDRRRNVS